MDKETLSHYGWIVILVLILACLLAVATPFGNFIATGIKAFAAGFVDVNNEAMEQVDPNTGKIPADQCSHENTELQNQKSASCKANGYTGDEVCKDCNTTIKTGTVVNKTAHTAVTDPAVAATCEQKGKTEGSHCSVCKTQLVAQRETDALGHDWGDPYVAEQATCLGNGISRIACKRAGCDAHTDTTIVAEGHKPTAVKGYAATCTKTGLTDGEKCSKCGAEMKAQTTIKALGHTTVTDSAISATCEVAGKTEGKHCSVCNTVIKAQETVPALGHQMGDPVVTLNATCESAGQTKTSCKRAGCGYYEVGSISAKGHTTVIDKAIAATCEKTGKTEGSHCSTCSATIKAQTTIPALGHAMSDPIITTMPTCTADGYQKIECTRNGCDYEKRSTINKTGHTTVVDNAVSATCTIAGKTEGSHCSVCNTVIKAQETVPALGHSMGTPVTTLTATCTSEGQTKTSCTRTGCGYYKVDTVKATGHTEVIDKAVAATCTATGLTEGSHCSVCNAVITAQTATDALGHSYGTPTYTWTGYTACKASRTCSRCSNVESQNGTITNAVTTAAKCTTAGVRTYTAKFSNTAFATQTKTASIAATGHTEVVDNAVAATCTNTGLNAGSHCSVCNTVLTAQTVTPALGHNYGTPTYTWTGYTACSGSRTCSRCSNVESQNGTITNAVTTAAKCTTAGVRTYTAKFSNTAFTTQTKTENIAALGHTEVIDKAIPATCTATGLTAGKHCSACNTVLTTQTVTPALGHNYGTPTYTWTGYTACSGSRTCSRCGDIETATATITNAITKEATCTTEGVKTYTAKFSNTAFTTQTKTENIAALGHDYVSVVTKEPTCTEEGIITYICSRCGDEYTEPIPALGHTDNNGDGNCDKCTKYNVTLMYMDGVTPDKVVQANKSSDLPTPSRDGYIFDNWYLYEEVSGPKEITTFTNPNSTYPWTQDANGVWSSGNKGTKSSKSHMLSEEFTLTESGSISFDWRSNGESNYDYLGYDILNVSTGKYLSGKTTPSYSSCLATLKGKASANYTTVTYNLSAGTYKILFMYGKDSSTNSNEDQGFVKNVFVSGGGTSIKMDTPVPSEITEDITVAAKWIVYTEPTPYTLIVKADGLAELYTTDLQTPYKTYTERKAWLDDKTYIKKVVIEEGIGPEDTSYWFNLCKWIEEVEFAPGITEIGERMFYYCSSLKRITLPDTVTTIGNQSFRTCTSLTSIGPVGSGADLEIPDSVTKISSSSAFNECYNLTSVTIPDTITYIGVDAFSDCSKLTNVSFEEGSQLTSIASYAFKNSAINSIDLSPCTELTSIYNAFCGATNLQNVILPQSGSLTNIEWSAFNSTGITSVGPVGSGADLEIPDSVTTLGNYALAYNSQLTSIILPKNITTFSVGEYATFGANSALVNLSVESGNTKYHSSNNCIINTASKSVAAGCSTSVIPSDGSVTSIGSGAFRYCKSLTSITIPSDVTSISTYAFQGCSGLDTIYYEGTTAEWDLVKKGTNWKYEVPATEVICSDGTTCIDGHTQGTEATCQSKAICSKCGNGYGPVGTHVISDGVCTLCGTTATVIQSNHYPYQGNQSYVVLGTWNYSDATSVNITITYQIENSYYNWASITAGTDYVEGTSNTQRQYLTKTGGIATMTGSSSKYNQSNQFSSTTLTTQTFENIEMLTGSVIFKTSSVSMKYYGVTVTITPNYD